MTSGRVSWSYLLIDPEIPTSQNGKWHQIYDWALRIVVFSALQPLDGPGEARPSGEMSAGSAQCALRLRYNLESTGQYSGP